MKKVLLVVALLLVSVFALTGCEKKVDYSIKPVAKEDLKIGVICLHGEESTYDRNFISAVKLAVAQMYGEENVNKHLEIKTGIPEDASCEDAANELAKTCNIVFADSFGHESFMINAAAANPSVRFCHATGTKANTTSLANFSNAFASIYEGRYLAGYAAGLKLNLMKQANPSMVATIGYVGAFPYAEVVSGYTSFFLGVKAAYTGNDLTMKVRYTSSWYDYDAEYAAATALINKDNCVLISQHADSMGAPTACKENNIPNVTYNIETGDTCDKTYLAYSRINWAPYFTYIMECVMAGVRIDANYTGSLLSGSVEFNVTSSTDLWGDAVTATLNVGLVQAKALEIKAGLVKVFDTDTFTVGGNKLTEQLADVNDFGDYAPETQVIKDGEYKESLYRSAPYFDLRIDGISEIEEKAE